MIARARMNGLDVSRWWSLCGLLMLLLCPSPSLGQDELGAFSPDNAARGGGAQADFDSLIELIQSTIAPATWDDVGGEGSIIGFPGGVYVDSRGVMRQLDAEAKKNLKGLWKSAAEVARRSSAQQDVDRFSPRRKVSLRRLEQHLRDLALQGKPPTEVMQLMAGLESIEFVVIDDSARDVILIGPAGPWTVNAEGRIVSQEHGRPVMRLDDLVVLLRNAFLGKGQFVCSITPTQQNLARTQAYIQETSKRPLAQGERPEWLEGLRSSLGNQEIEIEGIDAQTRVARAIVEADHHMKLIGIGLEPGTDGVVSYLDSIDLAPGDQPPGLGVLRWWFTLEQNSVRQAGDGVFHFADQTVRVLSENELLTALGERIHTGEAEDLNREFARSFTGEFAQLSERYPIYGDLDNVFRLAIVANLMKHQDVVGLIGWSMPHFLNEDDCEVAFARVPKVVPSVINHRVVHRRHVIAGVSGGVSFRRQDLLRDGFSTSPKTLVPREWQRDGDVDTSEWWWD